MVSRKKEKNMTNNQDQQLDFILSLLTMLAAGGTQDITKELSKLKTRIVMLEDELVKLKQLL